MHYLLSSWPQGSVVPAPSVPEPEEAVNQRIYLPVRICLSQQGGAGPGGRRDTCAGREAGSDFGSGAGARAAAGADGSGVGA